MAVLIDVVLIVAIGLGISAAWRAWPRVRQQGERMRREGGPRGADFDDFVARKMEKLPVARASERPDTRKPRIQNRGDR
jgi:hypothetical protein